MVIIVMIMSLPVNVFADEIQKNGSKQVSNVSEEIVAEDNVEEENVEKET